MKYSVDKQEKFTIFKLQEDNLNSVLAPDLKSDLVVLAQEGVRNLIFDLSEVKFVDSSGLSAILTGNRLWNTDDSHFILTGVEQPAVKKLIEISRLDNILTLIPTVQESMDYVYMLELERELNADDTEEATEL